MEANDEKPRSSVLDVAAYISPDYAAAERDKLWRKVWQQACRLEDLSEAGSYLTYEIGTDSILIVRDEGAVIRAFHNVCPHRGRRLVDVPSGAHHAEGRKQSFVCGFHAWTFDTSGRCTYVRNIDDWCGDLTPDRTQLGAVRCDTWGGWIWINLDPHCEPLRDYLEPAASVLDPFQLENMRARWRRWLNFDCNWKVALEAFSETYHVPGTHPEFMAFGDFTGWGRQRGKHSHIGYDAPKGLDENKAKLRLGAGEDPRISTAEMQVYTWREVNTNTTKTLVDASLRLKDELPEGTPADVVLRHWLDSARADDERRGVFWPKIDPQAVGESGTSWQIFPNVQIGHSVNNMLCYRARPIGFDPDKCIFEVAVYELYPSGEEPQTQWEYLERDDPKWGSVLPQDFANMAAVQLGMKSIGFRGPQPNPYAEGAVVSLHRNLSHYMGTQPPRPLADLKNS